MQTEGCNRKPSKFLLYFSCRWMGESNTDWHYHNGIEILNFSHILWSTNWPLLCIQCNCQITIETKYLTFCPFNGPQVAITNWFGFPQIYHVHYILKYLVIWDSDEIIRDKHWWTSYLKKWRNNKRQTLMNFFLKVCTNISSKFKLLLFFKSPEFPNEGPKIDKV